MEGTEFEKRFTYHAPTEDSAPRYRRLRAEFHRLGLMIGALAPESLERELAGTALDESMMWAKAALDRNPDNLPPVEVFERRFGEALCPSTV